ncbi:phage tail tube protein [Thalassomonas haliotis]|uniref:Phage tail protein n=1 Tax=Thalassomonas haliotis TaxID=485448 RepID=A0ABY7VCF7_9GAMM|nr:phage tail tube protein [Thalassomonas haliotis]WDE11345.1 hypothetical protein H3N35_24505 [Thalassomonas haliotis]
MATLGAGTLFKMSDMEQTPVFTAIPGVKTIGTIGEETPTVEVTSLADTAKQYIAGIVDGEEKEITVNYLKSDAEQKTFREAARAKETRDFEIEYPDGTKATMSMLLLGYKMNEAEMEAALTFTVKAKQVGTTTWTEA